MHVPAATAVSQSGKPSVLLCDDDDELNALLSEYLTLHGFTVASANRAEVAIARLQEGTSLIDILVLDVMLPGMDGLRALQTIRQTHDVPILMISGRGAPEDRVVGLELGADDYLSKPCLPRELLARLNALLRRRKGAVEARVAPITGANLGLSVGDLHIVENQRRAYLLLRALTGEWVQHELSLTGAEYATLVELARVPAEFVSRAQLTLRCLHRPLERFDRAIDVHVCRLRRKLEPSRLRIESARSAGYVLIVPTDAH
jgi:two-component system, OmpR family, response regulator CpxR